MKKVVQSLCFFLVDCRSVISAGYMIPPENYRAKSCNGDKEVSKSTRRPTMVNVSAICLFCAKGEHQSYHQQHHTTT